MPPRRTRWLTEGAERLLDRRLLRRNRLVRLMKFVLPLLALALVTMVIAWPQLYYRKPIIDIDFKRIASDGNKLTMENARYHGIDKQGRPFVITARQAIQDLAERRVVTLQALQADITLTDGTWVTINARQGIYNESTQLLQLAGDIGLFSDRGYEFHAETALVDLKAGTVTSEQPVNGQGPTGTVEGNRFRLGQKGQNIRFEDGVRVTVYPGAEG